jgi:uncharacterized lipoprotein
MPILRHSLLLLFITVLATAGCSVPWPFAARSTSVTQTTLAAQQSTPRALPSNTSDGETQASYATPVSYGAPTLSSTSGLPPEQALAQVLGDISEVGAIDPAAQQQLIKQLQAAKPAHYPLVVQQFKSAYAYSRELRERTQMVSLTPVEALPAAPPEVAQPRLLPVPTDGVGDPRLEPQNALQAPRGYW